MIDKHDMNCFSTFVPKGPQQQSAQGKISDRANSQFTVMPMRQGTLGTSAFIRIESRRQYKCNEK